MIGAINANHNWLTPRAANPPLRHRHQSDYPPPPPKQITAHSRDGPGGILKRRARSDEQELEQRLIHTQWSLDDNEEETVEHELYTTESFWGTGDHRLQIMGALCLILARRRGAQRQSAGRNRECEP